MDRLIILAIALVIASVLNGGIYTVSGGQATTHIINRFTGSGWYCAASNCLRLMKRD
jgi:hypothetical protein